MELRQVEYFVAVVDHGGVTKAAEALFLAQPSLSQAVRQLERELGAELFDRTGRHLVLTAAGRSFLEPARRILEDAERARGAVSAVSGLTGGRLDIAALAGLTTDPLPELAGRFHRKHPGVLLNIVDPGGPAAVTASVRHGQCDLGLTELPVHGDSLRTLPLGDQEIVLALPPALAEGLPDPVPLDAVADIPLVLELVDATTRTQLDDVLDGTAGRIAVECAHRQTVWHLVEHGAGATFLPRRVAERELQNVVVRATTPPVKRTIGLIFREGPLSPAAEAFLSAVTP
ncbi:LysR family transcriptional regulator [Amycolatopsis sp. NPDC059657]|uniref:LysR family transcriptional regulator n=1 Tax=Amycolatopsis sp. NPDC059657 TaxID=3346899 RepID=UPI00366D8BFC